MRLIEFGETPEIRRCHIDVVDARETKKLYMFHCVVIPHFHTPAPLYGLRCNRRLNKVTVSSTIVLHYQETSRPPYECLKKESKELLYTI